jgi:hypothetical protein
MLFSKQQVTPGIIYDVLETPIRRRGNEVSDRRRDLLEPPHDAPAHSQTTSNPEVVCQQCDAYLPFPRTHIHTRV